MEKIRNSSLLKIICYILIPILIAIFALSTFHLAFLNEYGYTNEKDYKETENFANNYLYFIIDKLSDCSRINTNYSNQSFIELEDSNGKTYYYSNNQPIYNYYDGIGAYIDYIIVEKETRNHIYKYEKQ